MSQLRAGGGPQRAGPQASSRLRSCSVLSHSGRQEPRGSAPLLRRRRWLRAPGGRPGFGAVPAAAARGRGPVEPPRTECAGAPGLVPRAAAPDPAGGRRGGPALLARGRGAVPRMAAGRDVGGRGSRPARRLRRLAQLLAARLLAGSGARPLRRGLLRQTAVPGRRARPVPQRAGLLTALTAARLPGDPAGARSPPPLAARGESGAGIPGPAARPGQLLPGPGDGTRDGA